MGQSRSDTHHGGMNIRKPVHIRKSSRGGLKDFAAAGWCFMTTRAQARRMTIHFADNDTITPFI